MRRTTIFSWFISVALMACDSSENTSAIVQGGDNGQSCDAKNRCEPGQYCQLSHCDAAEGACQIRPDACPDIWDPVCGCDGITYGNRCEAAAAAVSVDYTGVCRTICGGIAGIPCDDREVCEFPAGQCSTADLLGTCVPSPEACPRIFDPVCGCDGATYSNDCERRRAGVQKDHDGECRAFCGGIAGIPCNNGEVCEFPAGQCSTADLLGTCVPRPELCPAVYDPVCGCDGVTYGNDCERLSTGAQKDHDGECRSFCFDGASLLSWQRNLGTPTGATFATGDFDGDGDVDRDDLSVWQSQLGSCR